MVQKANVANLANASKCHTKIFPTAPGVLNFKNLVDFMYQGCQKLHIQLSDDRYEFIQPSKELHLLFQKKQMPLTDASICAETLAKPLL